MSVSPVTSSLSQGGVRLFDLLVERCRKQAEATNNDVMYTTLSGQLQGASDVEMVAAAIDEAQHLFSEGPEANRHFLGAFADLLSYTNDERAAFVCNLWCTFLFNSQNAASALWDQYQEIRHAASVDGLHFPSNWGDWILPMQSFASTLERTLIEQDQVFADLLLSSDLLELIEEMAAGETEPGFSPHTPTVLGNVPFDETTFEAYLSICTRYFGQADPQQPYRSSQASISLKDVYVPLKIVRLVDYNRPVDYARYRTAHYDDPELNAFHAPISQSELEAHPGETISEALAAHQLLLLLGDLGAGKTTLLRHLAFQHATRLLESPPGRLPFEKAIDGSARIRLDGLLPVYMDLGEYIEHRQGEESLYDFAVRWLHDLVRDDGVPSMLTSLLDSGQCLLLLDGLDRVATDEQRQIITSAVAEATRAWQAAGNQIVVTSRFEGYDITPLPRSFTTYLLRPFSRDQIRDFLLKWKQALYRLQPAHTADRKSQERFDVAPRELLGTITASPRLLSLLNTPLPLRLLVEVYQPGMLLQPHKAALYQLLTNALIHEWRLPQGASHRASVMEREAVTLLSELAYWLHSTRPTGVISEQELQQILGHIWREMRPGATPDEVQAAIGDFIGTLRLHSGVLCELTPQHYGFVYQGLQEYFAARRIVSSFRFAPERIREHLHDPRWNEVIALAIGFTALSSPDNASDLIETAVLARGDRAVMFGQASSPFESLLKRDLLFAARLLGDGVEARAEVTHAVVDQLMWLWLDGERSSLGRFTLIFDSARRHLMQLDGTYAGRLAFQIALEQLGAGGEYVRAYAVDALTFWPSLSEEAQQAIISLDMENEPLLVRRAAILALMRVDRLLPDSYDVLVQLTGNANEQICEMAREALAHRPPAPLSALRVLIGFLHSNNPLRRRVGLRRLRQIGALPRQVIAEILRLLDDPDPTTRRLAMETLAGVPNLPDDALTTIYQAIARSEPHARASAIETFARPVELPEQVVRQLILWSNDGDASVRIAAVTALGACANVDPAITDALLACVEDPSDSVRAAAVEPLVRKGQDHAYAGHMLTHIVADPIPEVRRAVARALRLIPEPDQNLQGVLNTLLSDRDMEVREAALETVGELRCPGTEVFNHLVALVEMPEHPFKPRAVAALAKLRDLPDEALLTLVRTLHSYGETLCEEITACLREHAPLSPRVLHELMDLAVLDDEWRHVRRVPPELRAAALTVLGTSLDNSTAPLRILVDGLRAEMQVVRVAAARGLAYAREVPRDVLETLQALQQSAQFEVRCAASITLGHLIRNLPYLPFEGDELLNIARALAQSLSELTPRAAWERESQEQNEVLQALSWVVARSRPVLPRLSDGSEDPPGYLDE